MRPLTSSQREGRHLAFERLLFFSDAVFAIAITLLVLDIRLPEHAPFDLEPLIPKFIGFGVSFYVIGRYWAAHHHLFQGVQGYDGALVTANLWFLASIAFLPFPTMVVIQSPPEPAPVTFYALSLAFTGLTMVSLTLFARRAKLLRDGETRGGTAHALISSAAAPLVFLIAAVAAPDHFHRALWLFALLFPVSWAGEWLGRALERRLDRTLPASAPEAPSP
jgi:uncharacterized membrane protein